MAGGPLHTCAVSTSPVLFGEYRLDPARRELWRGDARVHMQPKAFDCLTYLIANRDRAVGRDELIAAVWGKVEISDNILGQVVAHARRAVNDNGEEQRAIRTVPRFGYVWVAPVQDGAGAEAAAVPTGTAETSTGEELVPHAPATAAPVNGAAPADAAEATRIPARPPGAARRGFVAAAAIALAIAAVIGTLALWPSRRLAEAPAPGKLLLVLPVRVDADEQSGWMRLGLMDLMARRLHAAGAAVVPSDNVVALVRELGDAAPEQASLDALAGESGATLVFGGRVTAVAGAWRVGLSSVHGSDPPLTAEANAPEALEAARMAADRMAVQLSLAPPVAATTQGERSLALVLQQVEAAILAGQMDSARALLDGLDTEQRARPEARYRQAQVDWRAGRLDEAQAVFEGLLKDVSAADDPLLRAQVLNDLGNIHAWHHEYADVERGSDEAVALLARYDAPHELGRALTGRAIARAAQRRFDAALDDFGKARVLLEGIGDRLGLASVDANLGILESDRDRFAEALSTLGGAVERLQALGNRPQELLTRVALAWARLALLDPAAAADDEARLAELVAHEPNASLRAYANIARTRVLAANGRTQAAKALLADVQEDTVLSGDALLHDWSRAIQAEHLLAAGLAAEAAEAAKAALNGAWDVEDARGYAYAWLTLQRAELAQGATQAAAETAKACDAWADGRDVPAARIYADLVRAGQAAASGRADEARAAFEQAQGLADAGRVPLDQLRVAEAYVGWLLRVNDLPRAGVAVSRIAAWADRDYAAALLQLRFHHALGNTAAWENGLARVRRLAGERQVPAELVIPPVRAP